MIYSCTTHPPIPRDDSLRRIVIPVHAQQRMVERGSDPQLIRARITRALRLADEQNEILHGDHALLGGQPIIVDFRATCAIVQSVLELGMPLKAGTPILWA